MSENVISYKRKLRLKSFLGDLSSTIHLQLSLASLRVKPHLHMVCTVFPHCELPFATIDESFTYKKQSLILL